MPTNSSNEITVKSAADQTLLAAQVNAGALVVDSGRRRPFYFDGRFLTANDLIADQDYIRARQSDLAQAIGAGVIRGLEVSLSTDGTGQTPLIRIGAGSGITPAGDLVAVANATDVRLNDIPTSQQIDAQLGIKLLPTAATLNRSGLFVLALRSVEFSANPVAAYPTTLDGTRTVRDGDIVEATAVTLIPYPDRAGVENADAKRARVAREIFLDRLRPGALQEALPLAMVYLEGGAIRWMDMYMVRREVGAESTLTAGLSPRPRALLESWIKQYQEHLDDIDTSAVQAGFAATRYFEVLPPVGQVPAASFRFENVFGAPTLLQSFFPPLVDVEFAFIPSDELPALVQDALALPPLDLHADDADLDHVSILVVAPVTRQELEAHKRALQRVVRPVRAAASNLLSKRSPFESLIRLAQPVLNPPTDPEQQRIAEAWRLAIDGARAAADRVSLGRGMFWYLRKRQLPYTAEISGTTLRLGGDASTLDAEVEKRAEADKRVGEFNNLLKPLPRLAQAEVVNLLAAPRLGVSPTLPNKVLATSDILRRSAFTALVKARDASTSEEPNAPKYDHAAVLDVARRFGDPRLGEGFDALIDGADDDTRKKLTTDKSVKAIEESGVAPDLDRAARLLPTDRRAEFGSAIAKAASEGDVDALRKLAQS
ncbi:MAG TPA: hypothetical protein VFS42_03975 [Burkholderiaceae bacterium]|nr:hypothetical protein [Burkholderiaceae bacterium]